MRLSVILPVRDCEDTLGQQLEALAQQSWSDGWELVVVDNGSTDATRDVACSWRDRFDQLKVVDAFEKTGSPHARNVGVAASSGEGLAFCDGDDVVAPGWLEAIGNALAEHQLVVGRVETGRLNTADVHRYRRADRGTTLLNVYGYLPFGSTCNLAIRRDVHDSIGGFDEALLHSADTDYCWRAQLAGADIAAADDAVVHYRYRRSPREVFRQSLAWGRSNVQIHAKYLSHGVRRPSPRSSLVGWVRVLAAAPFVLSHAGRLRFAWLAGFRIGRIEQAIRSRFFTW